MTHPDPEDPFPPVRVRLVDLTRCGRAVSGLALAASSTLVVRLPRGGDDSRTIRMLERLLREVLPPPGVS